MMMNEVLLFIPAFVTGILLGVIFFGGLWWTVQKGLLSANPALWFISSLLIRTIITVTGFYLIAAGSWKKLLISLLGFLLIRFIIVRYSKVAIVNKESHHAP